MAYAYAYAYDNASNRLTFTDTQGAKTAYVHDALNRTTSIQDANANTFGFSYDTLGHRTRLTRPNGVNTSYSYDSLSHLLSVTHQGVASTLDGVSYTYDSAGNRTSKANLLNGTTSTYAYDSLYQLTSVMQGLNSVEAYSYDVVGNRLTSQAVSSYTYNTSNELTTADAATFTYDNNGNTLTKTDSAGVTRYSWDFENRLLSVVLPDGSVVSFQYDPFGRRIQKASVTFLYDGADLVEETDATGNLTAQYSFGLSIDEPLAAYRGGSLVFYDADGVGSITSLTTPNGAASDHFTYDSFGYPAPSTGTFLQPFRFTGREFDGETGPYYYRARYYDSHTARFLSEDPDKDGVSGSLYMYVENRPITMADPLGTKGLLVGPQTNPVWVTAFNEGFVEALKRVSDPDCKALFCGKGKKAKKLDLGQVLKDTEYRLLAFEKGSTAGTQTNSATDVFLNSNGPFVKPSATIYIPFDKLGMTSKRQVTFDSLAAMRAFVLLHELGHQLKVFSPDIFPFLNGTHSLRVIENCFKDATHD